MALRKLSSEKSKRLQFIQQKAERLLRLEKIKQAAIINDNQKDAFKMHKLLVKHASHSPTQMQIEK